MNNIISGSVVLIQSPPRPSIRLRLRVVRMVKFNALMTIESSVNAIAKLAVNADATMKINKPLLGGWVRVK